MPGHPFGPLGSYAMRIATEESDIDILVEFEYGADIWDLSSLKIYLENLFKKPVDVATETRSARR